MSSQGPSSPISLTSAATSSAQVHVRDTGRCSCCQCQPRRCQHCQRVADSAAAGAPPPSRARVLPSPRLDTVGGAVTATPSATRSAPAMMQRLAAAHRVATSRAGAGLTLGDCVPLSMVCHRCCDHSSSVLQQRCGSSLLFRARSSELFRARSCSQQNKDTAVSPARLARGLSGSSVLFRRRLIF